MKFFTAFLGCKVNSYEIQGVGCNLIKNGLIETNNKDEADIFIINTCAVTEVSANKSKKLIRQYRRNYPESIIVVMGCYSQYSSELISKEIGANIVIGTSYRDKIYEFILDFITNKKNIVKINESFNERKYENLSINNYFEKTRAFVKIQDGCNNFCTYCLIPYIRGISRSRNVDSIITEINDLINNGYKEIVLTGIDQGSYGTDFEIKSSFSNLLKKILETFPNLYRLRISSIEESQIDQQFLKLLKQYPNIANHLHIPLQSGSKKILKAMNRKYNLDEFKETIDKIREIRNDISITTDVIVGFPGETDEDFMETSNFIKQIGFSKVHVFPYSDRNGTKASKFENKIPNNIKHERVLKLLKLSKELQKRYSSRFYGSNIDFLMETYNKKTHISKGHSSNYLEVIVNSDKNLKDQILNVQFNEDIDAENFTV